MLVTAAPCAAELTGRLGLPAVRDGLLLQEPRGGAGPGPATPPGLAAASAQMSAKGLAAQVSGQTRALVDQASSLAGHVSENTRELAGSLPQAKALQEHATAVSGPTRALAERASSLSTAAAEQASSRMKGLGLSDGLGERLHLLARPGTGRGALCGRA